MSVPGAHPGPSLTSATVNDRIIPGVLAIGLGSALVLAVLVPAVALTYRRRVLGLLWGIAGLVGLRRSTGHRGVAGRLTGLTMVDARAPARTAPDDRPAVPDRPAAPDPSAG